MELDDLLRELNQVKMSYNRTNDVKAQIKELIKTYEKVEIMQNNQINKTKENLCQQFIFKFTSYFDKKLFDTLSHTDKFIREKGAVKFTMFISNREKHHITMVADIESFNQSVVISIHIRDSFLEQMKFEYPTYNNKPVTIENFSEIEAIEDMAVLEEIKAQISLYIDHYKMFWGKISMHDYAYKVFELEEVIHVDDVVQKLLSLYEIWRETR